VAHTEDDGPHGFAMRGHSLPIAERVREHIRGTLAAQGFTWPERLVIVAPPHYREEWTLPLAVAILAASEQCLEPTAVLYGELDGTGRLTDGTVLRDAVTP
jgi:predicted ATPase with chaperone activity